MPTGGGTLNSGAALWANNTKFIRIKNNWLLNNAVGGAVTGIITFGGNTDISRLEVINTVFENNSVSYVINANGPLTGSNITNVKIINSTISNNNRFVNARRESITVEAYNNIFDGNVFTNTAQNGAVFDFRFNIFSNSPNLANYAVFENNLINQTIDLDVTSLVPIPGSPAIGAGNNAYADGTLYAPITSDLAGNPRVSYGTIDMGAFEYINAAPVLDNALPLTMTSINEDAVNNNGDAVSALLSGLVTDLNPDPVGMAITSADNTNGSWQYSLDAGGTWSDIGNPEEMAAFLISPSTNSRLRFVPGNDFNGTINPGLTFRAWDGTSGVEGGTADAGVNGGTTAFSTESNTVNITVNAVNDAPSITLGSDQTINEDAGAQTLAAWATGISDRDPEVVQILTPTVTNNNNSLFSVQPSIDLGTGNLTYTPAVDANGTAIVTVSLADDGGTANGGVDNSGNQTFNITVNAVNDIPVITAYGGATSMDEDNPLTFNLNQFTVTDPDNTFPTGFFLFVQAGANYTISGENDSTITPAVDFNGTLTVQVIIDDGVDDSAPFEITVTVNSINDAPSITLGSDQTVNEDAGAQTLATWATGISDGDPEVAQILTPTITNNNNSLFSVQPSIDLTTGNLTYTPADDANGTAEVTVSLADDGGTANGGVDNSGNLTFNITVNAVNDAPSITLGSDQTVNEDAGAQTLAAWATGISDEDPEVAQILTPTVNNNNNSLFSVQPSIDLATGNLTYTPAGNANGTAEVTVSLADDGGIANGGVDNSGNQTFNVTVIAVNDAPTITVYGGTTSMDEDNPLTIELNQFSVTDIDNTFPTGFSLTVQTGANYTVNGADITPVTDYNGTLTVPVIVNDGTDDSVPFEITVTVNAVNDAPVLEPILPQQVIVNNQLTFTVSASDPIEGDNLTYSLGVDALAGMNIEAGTGVFTWTPADGDVGMHTVTITVTDDGTPVNESDSETASITVQPAGSPSVDQGIADQSADEDAAFSFDVPGDAFSDPDGDPLTLEATLADGTALTDTWLTFDGTTFSGTPMQSDVGEHFIEVTATDPGGLNGSVIFSITVNNVNDAPVITAYNGSTETDEDIPFDIDLASLLVTDEDNNFPADFTMLVENGENYIVSVGRVIPLPDFNGIIEVGVKVTDGELFSNVFTISITVNPVNDAPVISPIGTKFAFETQLLEILVQAEDVEGDAITYTTSNGMGQTIDQTGMFSWTPPEGSAGDNLVIITVSDGDLSSNQIFTITVLPFVDGAPTIVNSINAQITDEDSAYELDITGVFDDDGGAENLSYTATLLDDSPLPTWLDFAGTNFSGTPEQSDVGDYDIKLIATDGDGKATATTFVLSVSEVNDTPQLVGILENQTAAAGSFFSYTLPAPLFADEEQEESSLSISTLLNNGNPLPQWLVFNNGTFSGTPDNADSGLLYTISVIASDAGGLTASTQFTLFVDNAVTPGQPVLNGSLTNQQVDEDQDLGPYIFPADLFTDPAGQAISYSAALSDGTSLDNIWLSFDATTRSFGGMPTADAQAGTYFIIVTATNEDGLTASAGFSIEVTAVNDVPEQKIILLGEQPAITGVAFEFIIPANTFEDEEDGINLTYSAVLVDGTPLDGVASWLTFDPASLTISGTPPTEEVTGVVVTATDSGGKSGELSFLIDVVTGLDEGMLSATIYIYPNPVDQKFTLKIQSVKKGTFDLRLIDLSGKVLQSKKIELTEGSIEQDIDVSDLKSGIYFVEITLGQERISRRIVRK